MAVSGVDRCSGMAFIARNASHAMRAKTAALEPGERAHHDLAIKAYQLQAPLIVTGDLVFEKRAWRLTGDIQVDARLLDRVD